MTNIAMIETLDQSATRQESKNVFEITTIRVCNLSSQHLGSVEVSILISANQTNFEYFPQGVSEGKEERVVRI